MIYKEYNVAVNTFFSPIIVLVNITLSLIPHILFDLDLRVGGKGAAGVRLCQYRKGWSNVVIQIIVGTRTVGRTRTYLVG